MNKNASGGRWEQMTDGIIIAVTHWQIYLVYNMNRGYNIVYLDRGSRRLRG